MSFGGHVLDMINRLNQNKAMLNRRRERYRELRDKFYDVNSPLGPHDGLEYRKLTKEERLALKNEIKRLDRRDLIVNIGAFIFALLTVMSGIYYFFFVK